MENNELKEVHIKNRTCYYFDYLINLEDFDLDNVLIDRKSHENILIYDISYRTLIDPKPLRIRFFKKDGIIRIYDGTRCLTSYKPKKWNHTYFFHYFAKIKVDFYDSLPIEERLTLRNIAIHIKSLLNKDKNYNYYKNFLENSLIN